jgi:hypothetical protein
MKWKKPENKGGVLRTPPLFSVSFHNRRKSYESDCKAD